MIDTGYELPNQFFPDYPTPEGKFETHIKSTSQFHIGFISGDDFHWFDTFKIFLANRRQLDRFLYSYIVVQSPKTLRLKEFKFIGNNKNIDDSDIPSNVELYAKLANIQKYEFWVSRLQPTLYIVAPLEEY